MKLIKQRREFLIVGILLACAVLVPFFKNGIYRGQDLQFHLSRFDGIVTAIQDGQFPLAIYPYKNFGYGYASPLFYSDLFLIFPAAVRYLVNIPVITMYKIIVFACVSITLTSLLYGTYYISKSRKASFLVTFLFAFCNYYLTDLYVRCAFGEIMAMSFLPLLILAIYRYIKEDSEDYLMLGILFACVAHAHLITFVLACLTFGLFLFMNCKIWFFNRTKPVVLMKAILVGFGLSFVFFVPMLEQYTAQKLVVHTISDNMLQSHLVPLSELFNDIAFQFDFRLAYSEGLEQMDLTKNMGVFLLILPLGYIRCKEKNSFITQCFFLMMLYIAISVGIIPLYKIGFLNFIQFPSRFYIIASMLSCYIIAYYFGQSLDDKAMTCVSLLLVILNCFNVSFLFAAMMNKEEVVIIPENTTAHELFTLRKYAKHETKYVTTNREEVMNGEYLPYTFNVNYVTMGDYIAYYDFTQAVENYERSGTCFQFATDFDYSADLLLPLSFYKGYKAFEINEDGEILKEIECIAEEYTRRVSIHVEKGQHIYRIHYEGTLIQKVSCIITGVSGVLILILLIRETIQAERRRNKGQMLSVENDS